MQIGEETMRSSWTEPYLWVHLAGIAAVPIFLELCLIGLAASQAVLPAGFVFLLVALVGILPILWMQWHRPFSIFSLVVLALKPSELTETQRQILQRFKTPVAKSVAVTMAILALLILGQLNQWLPFQSAIFKVPGGWFGGLLLAAITFLLSNLFLQVPASVLMVLLTPERQIAAASPYPVAQIPFDFTLIGLQVKQVLPPIGTSAPMTSAPVVPKPSSASPVSEPVTVAETVQPEVVQPETAQPEVVQPETAQPEVVQPETAPLEAHQPEISEPQFLQAEVEEANPAKRASGSERVQAEPSAAVGEAIAVEKTASNRQEPPTLAAVAPVARPPHVTDTVVTIKLPLTGDAFAASDSSDPNEDGSFEPSGTDALVPSLPTVTDTIVTIL